MSHNVPNLDCMSNDELWEFWKRYQRRRTRKDMAELIGDKRKGYTVLAARLGAYACYKAVAMRCRLEGDTNGAMCYEGICDSIYKDIPYDLRWWAFNGLPIASPARGNREAINMQAIATKYLGPTNSRGARVKATCQAGSVVIAWDDADDVDQNHMNAALALCNKFAWAEDCNLVWGGLPNGEGNAYVLVRK
jgi:hypothetical protein